MRRASSNTTLSTARSDLLFHGGGRTRGLTLMRSPRARGMRLVVDPRDGGVRLTLPARTPVGTAIAWAESQRVWVETALAKIAPPVPFAPGAAIPFEGAMVTIEAAGSSRIVRIDGERLLVGGPPELIPGRVLRWLRAQARERLEGETRLVATRAGVSIGRVRIGDPRSRWGSCSAAGDIAYSWRLILAPPAVREATVTHEVAHRLHMHHGPAFHAAVADLLGRVPKAERAWLRQHGARLHGVGASW